MAGDRGGHGGDRQNMSPRPSYALQGGGGSAVTARAWGGAASTASPQPPSPPRPPSAKGSGTSTEKATDAPATPLKRSREDVKKSYNTDRQAITASHGEAADTKGSGGTSSAAPSPSSTPDPKTPRSNTPPGSENATSPRWADEVEEVEEKGKYKNNPFNVLRDTEDDDDDDEKKKEEQELEKKATLPAAESAAPEQPEEK